jgi:broad specificity phosphatase PhoE
MKEPGRMGTRVVVVRHGQTEWNRVERFRGRIDIELNDTGQLQAEAVAESLSASHIAAIYSSPLKRAFQTAQPTARACHLDVGILEAITDVDYGALAGLSPEEAAASYGELYSSWLNSPHLVQFPGGESLKQVRARVWIALQEVCAVHRKQTILLVSHVVVNRVLICAALGLGNESFWKIGQDNGSISILEASNGRYNLLKLNDTCHLKALQSKKVDGQTTPRGLDEPRETRIG